MGPMGKKWMWLVMSVGLVLGIALGVVWTVWGDLLDGAGQLPDRKKDALAAGLTLDPLLIGRELEVPAADNAYFELEPVYRSVQEGKLFEWKVGGERVQDWDKVPGLYEKTVKALRKPSYTVPRDYSKGMLMLFPDYASAKALGKGLALKIKDDSRRSSLPGAQEAEIALDQLARHVSREPMLIAGLVATAIDAMRLSAVWEAASQHPGDAHWLRWAANVAHPAVKLNLAATVRAEVALTYPTFASGDPWGRDWIRIFGNEDIMGTKPDRLPPVGLGSRDAGAARYLQYMTKLYQDLLSSPTPEAVSDICYAFETTLHKDKRPSSIATNLWTPVFPATALSVINHARKADVVRASAWVLDQKRLTGSFPSNLPAEFEGKVTYKRRDDGFSAYDIGRNGKDEGGPTEPGLRKLARDDDFGVLYKVKS